MPASGDGPEDLSPSQLYVILVTQMVSATLTMLGSLFIIILIVLLGRFSFFPQRILFWLAVAAVIGSLGYLTGDLSALGSEPLCVFQATIITFSDWAVVMWVFCLAFNLYLVVVHRDLRTERFESLFHGVSWGVSLAFSVAPVIGNVYGSASTFCWIQADHPQWRFAIWYIPTMAILVFIIVAFACVAQYIRHESQEDAPLLLDHTARMNRRLLLYPLAYIVSSVIPVTLRLQELVDPHEPMFALMILHSFTAPLQGFLNAIIYALDADTRRYLNPCMFSSLFIRSRSSASSFQEFTPASISLPEADSRTTSIRHSLRT